MMADRSEVRRLEENERIKPFDEFVSDKMRRKGMSEEQAYEDILKRQE